MHVVRMQLVLVLLAIATSGAMGAPGASASAALKLQTHHANDRDFNSNVAIATVDTRSSSMSMSPPRPRPRIRTMAVGTDADAWFATIVDPSLCPSARFFTVRESDGAVLVACAGPLGGVLEVLQPSSRVSVLANASQCVDPQHIVVRTSDGAVLVACSTQVVSIVGPGPMVKTEVNQSQCPQPVLLTVRSSDNTLFVACGDRGGVIRLNMSSGIVTTVSDSNSCPTPVHIVIRSTDGTVFAACQGRGIVRIVNTTTTLLVNRTQCPTSRHIVLSRDESLVVACAGGGVVQWSNNSVVPLTNGSLCFSARHIAIRNNDRAVFAACYSGGIVSVIGARASTLVGTVDCPLPQQLLVRQKDGAVFALCWLTSTGDTGFVLQISTDSSGLTSASTMISNLVCPGPRHIGGLPDRDNVAAACWAGGLIVAIPEPVRILVDSSLCQSVRHAVTRVSDGALIVGCSLGGVMQVLGSAVTTLLPVTECLGGLYIALRGDDAVICGCSNGVFLVINGSAMLLADGTQCPLALFLVVRRDGAIIAVCSTGVIIIEERNLRIEVRTLASSSQCPTPLSAALRPSDDKVFLACFGTGVSRVDEPEGGVVALTSVTECSGPYSVVFRADDVLFAACGNGLIRLDGSIVTVFRQCVGARSLVIRPADGTLLAACDSGGIVRVDASNVISVAVSSARCASPTHVALGPKGSFLVSCKGTISPPTGTILLLANDSMSTIALGDQCVGPVFSDVRSSDGLVVVGCAQTGVVAVDTTCGHTSGHGVAAGVCTPCTAGRSKPPDGALCAPCAPGYYAFTSRASACEPASVGTYDPGIEPRIFSVACPPGTFSGQPASTACAPCSAGRFASAPGATVCNQCNKGFFSINGSASCTSCEPVGSFVRRFSTEPSLHVHTHRGCTRAQRRPRSVRPARQARRETQAAPLHATDATRRSTRKGRPCVNAAPAAQVSTRCTKMSPKGSLTNVVGVLSAPIAHLLAWFRSPLAITFSATTRHKRFKRFSVPVVVVKPTECVARIAHPRLTIPSVAVALHLTRSGTERAWPVMVLTALLFLR